MARYEAGETLANIARSYDCSPPAISYIVSRSRARGVAPNAVVSRVVAPSERQLPEGQGIEATVGESGAPDSAGVQMPADELGSADRGGESAGLTELPVTGAAPELTQVHHGASPNGSERLADEVHPEHDYMNEENNVPEARASETFDGAARRNGPQRTLHLSQPHYDDQRSLTEQHANSSRTANFPDSLVPSATLPDHRGLDRSGGAVGGGPQPSGNGAQPLIPAEPRNNNEGGTCIDIALRQRVQGDIAAFLAAFDAALDRDTSETRAELRQATDRLLRAGARTRIELERLEARVPLPPRNSERPADAAWRRR
jgi:hypothetical protein